MSVYREKTTQVTNEGLRLMVRAANVECAGLDHGFLDFKIVKINIYIF